MKTSMKWTMVGACLLGALAAAGCSDDDETGNPTTTSGTPTSGTGASGGSGATGGTGGSDTGGGGSGGSPATYTFDTTPVADFVQTDRHGAVEAGTVGISAPAGLGLDGEDISLRDDYNASNPAEDVAGMWVPDIESSLNALHAAVDDDLVGLGLTPATTPQSLAQAGPVIVPDTIKFDPSQPAAYPNGRALTDRVVDLTIAAALIKLDPTPITVLADIPVNPGANDVPFKPAFPYLADPH